LEAIENGAKTLIDIVANVYSEVDRSLWFPASSNVRLHVEHLAQQNKLPKVISAMFVLQIYFPSNSKYKHLYSMVLVSVYSFIGKHQIVPMHSLLSLIDSNKPGGGGNTHKGLEECFFKEKKLVQLH
jgi:hypothetical protein